jgi:hypothetical protein
VELGTIEMEHLLGTSRLVAGQQTQPASLENCVRYGSVSSNSLCSSSHGEPPPEDRRQKDKRAVEDHYHKMER